jgi:hypothetical protein
MKTLNYSYRLLASAVLVIFMSILASCSDDSSGPQNGGSVEGSITFTDNGASLTDSTQWPSSPDTSRAFPGRLKVAFVPLDRATRAPRIGPVAAVPGLGAFGGIPFGALQNGVFSFNSGQARDANNNLIGSLPADLYGVYVAYVNPFLDGQAAQQFVAPAVVVEVTNGGVITGVTGTVRVDSARKLMIEGRDNGVFSGTITSTTPAANWPAVPAGSAAAYPQGTEFIAVNGSRIGAPPGPPAIFRPLSPPVSGSSATTFSLTIPKGTYRRVTINKFRRDSASPGGFATLSTLATYVNSTNNQDSTFTLSRTARNVIWNASIAP